jgi:hypothetical protein
MGAEESKTRWNRYIFLHDLYFYSSCVSIVFPLIWGYGLWNYLVMNYCPSLGIASYSVTNHLSLVFTVVDLFIVSILSVDNDFLSIFTRCSDCIYILLFLTLVVLSLFSCFYPDSRLYGIDTCEYHS